MELSPLARERLSRIGDLSPEEKERAKQSEELDAILSEYFKGDLTSEDLWMRLKAFKERSGEAAVKEAQTKLVDTLRLHMSQGDFEQRRGAILAIETVKTEAKYPTLEVVLNSIEALRQKYTQVKEQAYEQLKAGMGEQLKSAAAQALRQGMAVDMEGTLEANIKASPQWKDFVSRHDATSEQMFNSYLVKLREVI